MAFRVARVLAILAFITCLAGAIPAAAVVRAASGSMADAPLLWMLVPVLSTGGVLFVVRRHRFEPVCVLTGACWGFVLLGAWSLGLSFAPAALLLFAAGMAHVVAVRAGWRAAMAPLWFLAGASGSCALFFVRDQVLALLSDQQISSAPAVIVGTWALAGITLLLVVMTQATSRRCSGMAGS